MKEDEGTDGRSRRNEGGKEDIGRVGERRCMTGE